MIRLTEIFLGPVEYNEDSKTNVGTYDLREVVINPKYIVVIRAATDLQNKAANTNLPLVAGLHPSASYTQILMHCPSRVAALVVNVVGSLSQITEKIMVD